MLGHPARNVPISIGLIFYLSYAQISKITAKLLKFCFDAYLKQECSTWL